VRATNELGEAAPPDADASAPPAVATEPPASASPPVHMTGARSRSLGVRRGRAHAIPADDTQSSPSPSPAPAAASSASGGSPVMEPATPPASAPTTARASRRGRAGAAAEVATQAAEQTAPSTKRRRGPRPPASPEPAAAGSLIEVDTPGPRAQEAAEDGITATDTAEAGPSTKRGRARGQRQPSGEEAHPSGDDHDAAPEAALVEGAPPTLRRGGKRAAAAAAAVQPVDDTPGHSAAKRGRRTASADEAAEGPQPGSSSARASATPDDGPSRAVRAHAASVGRPPRVVFTGVDDAKWAKVRRASGHGLQHRNGGT